MMLRSSLRKTALMRRYEQQIKDQERYRETKRADPKKISAMPYLISRT